MTLAYRAIAVTGAAGLSRAWAERRGRAAEWLHESRVRSTVGTDPVTEGDHERDLPVPTVYVNRRTNFSAVSATSRQPLSMVSEWPRLGILAISVTAGLRRCRL
jgi:hypothetical protein